mmetsp:Transcript_51336/g.136014  ORF Transcript_51336/g.136014 Transcript_51336/m.136014 type:complete len:234 (-) Transcript_51336:791-1492(-)
MQEVSGGDDMPLLVYDLDTKAVAKLVLQMERRTEAAKAASRHDANPPTQCVGLLHRVSREHNAPLCLGERNQAPHGAPSLWVEASGRFVEEDYGRVSEQRDGERDTPLHAAAQFSNDAPSRERQLNRCRRRHRRFGPLVPRHPFDLAKDAQRLVHGQQRPEGVKLRADAEALVDPVHLGAQVEATDECSTSRRRVEPGEHRDGRRLSSSVGPQQSKAFTLLDRETQVAHGYFA